MAIQQNTGHEHTLATVGASDSVFTFKGDDGKPMPVRVVTDEDGEPWFVAKDVCAILGYSNPRKAVIDHVDDEDKTDGVTIRDSIGRQQNPIVINESGLYGLVLSSKLPKAHDFKHWVTSDVLPSIRKTGMYATPQTMDTMLNDPDAFLRLVQDWHDAKTQAAQQAKQLQAQAPKVEAYDDWLDGQDTMLIREAAKTISHTGHRYKESQIRQLLVEWGWAYKSASGFWQPTAYASIEHEWLVLVPCKSHGVKKDGMRFDFPPVMRLTRRGFDRLRARLRDIDSQADDDGVGYGLPDGDNLIMTRHGVKHLTLKLLEE
ncbi:BRO family protein [Pseudoscardovia suis]|uniref:Phage antirepressor n=1 Tax=Pseudoscardovia suis TaxID=987063 RepID=A0A261EQB4_9BIFI|nr:BRO family protein [Pseudoscardovia suis]OZG48876.1 phage antirepressor [Pseudoscardovia suis]PJJ63932.1 prophage antirepressor-like protein [Pseudoscardovia suis]